MIISMVAIAKNGVIGKTGAKLPWHIPEEIKMFKEITTGNVVVMGRKTYESIGKPLPNRRNIVISSTMEPAEGVEVCRSINEALALGAEGKDKTTFIIGGADIFKQTLPCVDKLYVSHLKDAYEGDIFFPKTDWDAWKVEKKEDRGAFEFTIYSKA